MNNHAGFTEVKMNDISNVIELKTKKEQIMKDTNVKNEVNATLSKLTEEQLQGLKGFFMEL